MIGSARLSGLLLAQSAECVMGGVALVTAPCFNRHHGNMDLAWDLDLTFAVIYLFLPWLNFSDSCHSQHLLYMLWPCCSLIASNFLGRPASS